VTKRYDRAYFDRWYRKPASRVITPAVIARKARMVIAVAEYFSGAAVRSVLDVGCGEGEWFPVLRRMRPGIRYLGIDPSEYAVERFGARRNIRLGAFDDVASHADGRTFDVIICSDVMQYVAPAPLRRGVEQISEHLGGVAFLEAHTTADLLDGDMRGWHRRTPGYYRRIFADAGLVGCGPHCWLGESLLANASALELVTL
jgi:SAM-dependent methyltransferase